MWYEARWILVRRLFGQALIQKIFFRVIRSIWEENNEDPPGLRIFVVEVFGVSSASILKTLEWDTWATYWDGYHEGWVSATAVYCASKRVEIMGPLAALLGRMADHHLSTHGVIIRKAIRKVIEDSVELRPGGIH